MGLSIKTFDSESFCGYKQISTFYSDFSIAEHFGLDAVKTTYKTAFKEWKKDYKMITELCMVLNWKSWEHSDGITSGGELCDWYIEQYYELRDWCFDTLKGDELEYFIRTTD